MGIRSVADNAVKKKVKKLIVEGAGSKGLNLDELMTDNIEAKLDDLLQAILDDVGYIKLVKLGLLK